MSKLIKILVKKGVRIPNPESVEIGEDVSPERISGNQVVIHTGCKIFGAKTFIHDGCRIGYEGPVTMENCRIGADVNLASGFFRGAVFLNGASAGSGSHVREGTILEEQANIAHAVGLKQTILFPFVTLGSLINFCDCLMAGGSSRTDHSEVGSSFIHFNYTPNQDKATPSLIGDVPRGVMLTRSPIFLGGQGGLVGPCRLAFGTITAAGTIWRRDEMEPGMLLYEGLGRRGRKSFQAGLYRNVKRITLNNLTYIANLAALLHWYRHVRRLFVSERFPEALSEGLQETVRTGIEERIRQFEKFVGNLSRSIQLHHAISEKNITELQLSQKEALMKVWPEIKAGLRNGADHTGDDSLRDSFLEAVQRGIPKDGPEYLEVIAGLPRGISETGTRWLETIVDQVRGTALGQLPSFKEPASGGEGG